MLNRSPRAARGIERIIRTCEADADPRPRRLARDLKRLEALGARGGSWEDRFVLRDVIAGPRRSLCLVGELRVPGLVWVGPEGVDLEQATSRNDEWLVTLFLASNYPVVRPGAVVAPANCFAPHVLLHRFSSAVGLPPTAAAFLDRERFPDGAVCLLESWTGTIDVELATCFFQSSRVLTGAAFRREGEDAGLNPVAADFFCALSAQGRLPLGKPLPVPRFGDEALAGTSAGDDPAIEWLETE
jgi:hypothetical protein